MHQGQQNKTKKKFFPVQLPFKLSFILVSQASVKKLVLFFSPCLPHTKKKERGSSSSLTGSYIYSSQMHIPVFSRVQQLVYHKMSHGKISVKYFRQRTSSVL